MRNSEHPLAGDRGGESQEQEVNVEQELLSSPEGRMVANFIRHSYALDLNLQVDHRAPALIGALVNRGFLRPESQQKLLGLIENNSSKNEPPDRSLGRPKPRRNAHSYWLSEDTAEQYESGAQAHDNGIKLFAEKSEAVTQSLKSGDNVFDLGAGTGRVAEIINNALPLDRQVNIYGTDIPPAMLEKNTHRSEYREIAIGDLQEGLPESYLSLKPKLIVSIGVFHYFRPEGLKNALAIIGSVIDQAGTLSFTLTMRSKEHPINNNNTIPIYDYPKNLEGEQAQEVQVGVGDPKTLYHYYDEAWVVSLLEQNDLEIIEAIDILNPGQTVETPSKFITCRKKPRILDELQK